MANQQLFDRYLGSLNSGYTAGGGSLVVASASGLPSGGNFYMIVAAEGGNTEEVFLVTARSGTTLTVTGAQWGTSASNHASSAQIIGPIFGSDVIKGLAADILLADTYANLPASGPPASRAKFVSTDGPYEFHWNGSVWVPILPGFGQATLPVSGSYTQTNIGSSTVASTSGPMVLSVPAGTSGWNVRQLVKSVPSAPYTFKALVSPAIYSGQRAGLMLKNSGTGEIITYELYSNNGVLQLNSSKLNSATSANGANFGAYGSFLGSQGIWMGISDDNTNRSFQVSINGREWQDVLIQGRTVFITPDQIGFFVNTDNGVASSLSVAHVV